MSEIPSNDEIGLLDLQTVLIMFEVIEDEHCALKLRTGCLPRSPKPPPTAQGLPILDWLRVSYHLSPFLDAMRKRCLPDHHRLAVRA